jgi:hypothetical protein
MLHSKPLSDLLNYHSDYYEAIKSNEVRFVFTGIEEYECDHIINICLELFGIHYDYIFFTEDKIFEYENATHPYGCFYFFPYGYRENLKELTKEEIADLYWY